MGQFHNNLKTKSAKQQAELVAKEAVKLNKISKTKREGNWKGYIEVISIEEIEKGYKLLVKVWDKNNKKIGFGKDGTVEIETFNVINPCYLIDDPTGDIIKTYRVGGGPSATTREQRQKEDVKEALLETLESTLRVHTEKHDDSKIILGKVGSTTSTFYPDADAESTSVDGTCNHNGSQTWATVHDAGTSASAGDSSWQSDGPGVHVYTTTWWQIRRFFAIFDTGGTIPATDDVSSATFSATSSNTNDNINDANSWVGLIQTNPAIDTAIATTDYDAINTTEGSDTRQDIGDWAVDEEVDWVLNATGIGWINATGKGAGEVTKLGLLEGHDLLDDPYNPAGFAGFLFEGNEPYTADNGSKKPKLVVIHAPSTSQKKVMGLTRASIKTIDGLAIASVKSIMGLE